MEKIVKPGLEKESYSCPHCHAIAGMEKYEEVLTMVNSVWKCTYGMMINHDSDIRKKIGEIKKINVVTCRACKNIQIWLDNQMIYPDSSSLPSPGDNMPESVKEIYIEAANVFPKSPRAASALLRLAVQKLCTELGLPGKRIDDDIKELVNRGMPEEIQKALDSIRVIGNNAVHPGEIDLNENEEFVMALFSILNFIVEKMITDKKRVDEIYDFLPEGAKAAMENRNRKTKG